MPIPLTDWSFRVIWTSLSTSNRIFCLIFCAVLIYTFYVVVKVMILVGPFRNRPVDAQETLVSGSLDVLRNRLANIRQLHLFTFYLFSTCILINLPDVFQTTGTSKTFPIGSILMGVAFVLYYDAVVILGLLLLHTIQWMASASLESFARRKI
jgi:hypothetical protein